MNVDLVTLLADQAAASASDVGDPVTVGRDQWFALMDAIYDPDEADDE